MNKIELIQALKDSNNLSKSEAETVINLFFSKMAEALTQGDRVEIRGLCSFFRVTVRNNSTRLRRIMVCLQGTSTCAYRDTCGWM